MDERIPPQLEMADVMDLKSMSKEELDKVPFEVLYWFCSINHCHRYTRVRDYGIVGNNGVTHEFYWPRAKGPWVDVFDHIRICSKHWKVYLEYKKGLKPDLIINTTYPVKKDILKEYIKMLKLEQIKLFS